MVRLFLRPLFTHEPCKEHRHENRRDKSRRDHPAEDAGTHRVARRGAGQMRSKHYGEEDRSGRQLKRLALVFSEEKRQFTAWQTV